MQFLIIFKKREYMNSEFIQMPLFSNSFVWQFIDQ